MSIADQQFNDASAVGFALTLQPMVRRLRHAEQMFQDAYFVASTLEWKMNRRVPNFVWSQIQQLDSGINTAHFKKRDAVDMLKRMINGSTGLWTTGYYEQAQMQNELDDFVMRLEQHALSMKEKMDRIMMSAVEAEAAQVNEMVDYE